MGRSKAAKRATEETVEEPVVKKQRENEDKEEKVSQKKGKMKKEIKEESVTPSRRTSRKAALAAVVKIEYGEDSGEDLDYTSDYDEMEDKPTKRKTKTAAAKPKQRGQKKKGDTVIKEEPNDTELVADDDNVLTETNIKEEGATVSGKGTKNKSKKKESSKAGKENIEKETKPVKSGIDRKMVVKGRAAVDGLCPIVSTSHVVDDDEAIWDCMLNQTNIQFNNNKYFLIQLLKDDSRNTYSVWMRWGRVGLNGQNKLHPCGSDLMKAKDIFMKKFSDKTKNDWHERDEFEKVNGKYDLLKMDYSKSEDVTDAVEKAEAAKKAAKVDCLLEARVRELIELICNVQTMEDVVVEMKYDAKKAPLGKLTTEQIKAGYLALKKLDELITAGKTGNSQLLQSCNEFYTRIPHYFGMSVPPLIRSKSDIQAKIALLDALGDIQAAMNILGEQIDVNTHPADQHYKGLECDIKALEKDSTDFKLLEKYLQTTQGKTHTQFKMEVLEIFTVKKEKEYSRFKDVGNRMLLWHGSRMSNWAGILSQGLRIAPPEAPVTGYMFGKGIYFADSSSKSSNYCMPSQRNNVGMMVLSEVSLGSPNLLLNADYNADRLPAGRQSVKGQGKLAPKEENFVKLDDGAIIPMGPLVQTGIDNKGGYTLQYNEYIVYNPSQVRTRYLFKIKFNFK